MTSPPTDSGIEAADVPAMSVSAPESPLEGDTQPGSPASHATPSEGPIARTPQRRGRARRRKSLVPLRIRLPLQMSLIALFLAAWEYLPNIVAVSSNVKIFDQFYISSPSTVLKIVWRMATEGGEGSTPNLWPYLATTLTGTIEGAALGILFGALVGLILSNAQRISDVIQPFIMALNTIPRVALIPIFVLLLGPTVRASVLSVLTGVFFIVFFNAYQGGREVKKSVIESATLLGASKIDIMRSIRLPSVVAWTFAAVPNAIAFGLVMAVTTELLAGIRGMGALLLTATTNVQAGLTFAVVVVLAVVGLVLSILTKMLERRVLHWQESER